LVVNFNFLQRRMTPALVVNFNFLQRESDAVASCELQLAAA